MNRKSTSVWTLSSVVTILCLMAGCLHGVGFTWTGVIVMNPGSGIVECGNDLGARVVDAFDVARPLPDNEYVVDEGNPTYSWYLNDSEIPCKWGRSVVFSTGDWDECGENGGRPDIDAGDFTLSVKGSRTYVVGWKDGNDCPCGCGMDDCECGGNGFRGCGGCGGKETKRGSSRQDAPVRGRHEQIYPINNYLLASADGINAKVVINYYDDDITNKTKIVKVGNKISLSVSLKNAEREGMITWNIPGKIFKDYDITKGNNEQLSIISNLDKGNKNLDYYWADGSENRSVECTVWFGEQDITGRAGFNILRPDVSVTVSIESGYSIGTFEESGKTFIFGTAPSYEGIKFTRALNVGNDFKNDQFAWVQIIKEGTVSIRPQNINISYRDALDKTFPYQPINQLSVMDHPGVPIHNDYEMINHSLKANMYLLYRPYGSEANAPQWVPLKKVYWECAGCAMKNNNVWYINSSDYTSNPIAVNTFDHPIWKCTNQR